MSGRELYERWRWGSIAARTNGKSFEKLYADERDCWDRLAAQVVPVSEVVEFVRDARPASLPAPETTNDERRAQGTERHR